MMMNLFSIFDPSINMNFSLNWISLLMILFFMPQYFWFIPSRYMMFWMYFKNLMNIEFKIILYKNLNKINSIMFINLMMMIFLINIYSLFPYIFSVSSHLVITLSMSLPLWLSIMMFGWINNMNFMFKHLTPQNTPFILMPFMVLIESISNFIRPFTLSIRLTANIIAGHLLITLISQSYIHCMFISLMFMIFFQMILMILELSVSIIQSYVFSILSSLYSSEIN